MNLGTILTEQNKASPSLSFFLWVLTLAALTASAKIQIPMVPVPITMQTVIVLALPCIFGYKSGISILCAYLMLGFAGIPVFAGPTAGPIYFFGPTGGYLLGFLIGAVFMSVCYRNLKTHNLLSISGLMLIGHLIILAFGFFWLAYGHPSLDTSKALAAGVLPFVTGSVLKSIVAALLVYRNPSARM